MFDDKPRLILSLQGHSPLIFPIFTESATTDRGDKNSGSDNTTLNPKPPNSTCKWDKDCTCTHCWKTDNFLQQILSHNVAINKQRKEAKSAAREALQKLTNQVLRTNPIAQWDKDKYECILNIKDPERTINAKDYPASAHEIR